jgi:hypothetical protein
MAMKEGAPRVSAWGTRKRFRLAVQVAVLVAAAVLLVVAVNVLARKLIVRFPGLRLDLTEVRLHSLQPPTADVLRGLDRDVRIVGIFKTWAWPNAPAEMQRELTSVQRSLYRRIIDLLREYSLRSPRIRLDLVDADADPRNAQRLAEELELDPKRRDETTRVVLLCGERRRDLLLSIPARGGGRLPRSWRSAPRTPSRRRSSPSPGNDPPGSTSFTDTGSETSTTPSRITASAARRDSFDGTGSSRSR